ncbi:hypothetical protein LCGC14_1210100 [marine sediment metagenome]|uniref:Uncharacterized protein n=1 Tax=marine sediment metagenome TaxID=412755 RepID=A0A0F9LIM3_9ZZZZ
MTTDKKTWIESLSVGDSVCDCRFKHLKISKIYEVWTPIAPSNILFKLTDWIPLAIFSFIWDARGWLYTKLGLVTLTDKDLILEDGAQCSAQHCCDPVDHAREHPNV